MLTQCGTLLCPAALIAHRANTRRAMGHSWDHQATWYGTGWSRSTSWWYVQGYVAYKHAWST